MAKVEKDIIERVKRIKALTKVEMKTEQETRRVEIIMLKFKEDAKVIDEAILRIVHFTQWPFKLTLYDNRPNTAHTSKIWNKLIRESTCDYVCMIDSDAFVTKSDPCWLTRMMASVEERGIVYPVGDNVGGLNGGYIGPEPDGSVMRMPEDIPPLNKVSPGDRVASGYCFLIKKSILDKVGWFDEDFYIYGQDSEWSYRCNKLNGAIVRQDAFVRHIGSYSFNKNDGDTHIDKQADKEWARRLFLRKTGIGHEKSQIAP